MVPLKHISQEAAGAGFALLLEFHAWIRKLEAQVCYTLNPGFFDWCLAILFGLAMECGTHNHRLQLFRRCATPYTLNRTF